MTKEVTTLVQSDELTSDGSRCTPKSLWALAWSLVWKSLYSGLSGGRYVMTKTDWRRTRGKTAAWGNVTWNILCVWTWHRIPCEKEFHCSNCNVKLLMFFRQYLDHFTWTKSCYIGSTILILKICLLLISVTILFSVTEIFKKQFNMKYILNTIDLT